MLVISGLSLKCPSPVWCASSVSTKGLLLRDRTIILNVIPYNPTEVPFDYKPPSSERTDRFNNIVRTYGVRTIIRQELGQDIDSACGMLHRNFISTSGSLSNTSILGAWDVHDVTDAFAIMNRKESILCAVAPWGCAAYARTLCFQDNSL